MLAAEAERPSPRPESARLHQCWLWSTDLSLARGHPAPGQPQGWAWLPGLGAAPGLWLGGHHVSGFQRRRAESFPHRMSVPPKVTPASPSPRNAGSGAAPSPPPTLSMWKMRSSSQTFSKHLSSVSTNTWGDRNQTRWSHQPRNTPGTAQSDWKAGKGPRDAGDCG